MLDRELYEKIIIDDINHANERISRFNGYAGPNTQIFGIVNNILTIMLKAKDANIISARVGVSQKGRREIAVFATRSGQAEMKIASDISQLSSGELMTLGLATEIIRAHEIASGFAPKSLDEVKGIVAIDEIDLHLHIGFQEAVLPKIIRSFTGVQFIVTTHSPFFLLGLAKTGEADIINLPLGSKIAPEEFQEFQLSLDIFIEKNNQFRDRYLFLEQQASQNTKTLVITEGKTDWKHIKHALITLQEQTKHTELALDFLEFENDIEMGDTKLSQMCEYMATLPQDKKIIFIFDKDNPSITKKMSGAPSEFKEWGNNVFSVCLPTPPHRANYKNLSIELYYTDEDLRSVDPATGKRLWFDNEIEITTRPSSGTKIFRALQTPITEDEFSKKCFDQPAHCIVDIDGRHVGLSKAAFTETIACNKEVSKDFDLSAFDLLFEVLKKI